MKLESTAFISQQPIPKKYSREGADLSPPLEWSDVPKGTQAFALVCEDPDAPRPEPWVHWLLANIPGSRREFEEGQPEGVEGRNDFGERGYGGPMPPPGHGTHHYQFMLYALDAPLDVKPGADKERLEKAMAGHVIEQAALVGTYER